MKQCKKCILPENYPEISFNEDGVCNNCVDYEVRWKNWESDEDSFVRQLKKQKTGQYAAVVGFSGGKDSSYLLHKVVKEYGFSNVLAVTFDNGFLSDGAKENIELLVSALGVEHEYHQLDQALNQRLYKAAVAKKSSELCMFCMAPAVTALIKVAKRTGTKLILMGSSPRTEPQFPLTMLNAFDDRFLQSVVEPSVSRNEYINEFKYSQPEQAFKAFLIDGIRFLSLPEFIDWNHDSIREFLVKEYGWVDHGKGSPHFDCLLEPIIDYFMYKRLGVSKVVQNLSILVRRGHLTRAEALERYKTLKPDTKPTWHIEEFCSRLSISESDLEEYLQGNSKDYTHFKSNAALIKRYSFLLKIAWKLKVIPSLVYKKYA